MVQAGLLQLVVVGGGGHPQLVLVNSGGHPSQWVCCVVVGILSWEWCDWLRGMTSGGVTGGVGWLEVWCGWRCD